MTTTTNQTVSVKIPGSAASSSKMQKKGWKCWALVVTEVLAPKPGKSITAADYVGKKVGANQTLTLPVGSVVIHYDDASNHGIGTVLADGEIEWEDTCDSDWEVAFAETARELLAPKTNTVSAPETGERQEVIDARNALAKLTAAELNSLLTTLGR